ncbi:MAG TPA: AAA-like domain-containing protein [Myxococcota bacterium]|nr:AAA-like domain-containing protein [Myxococcota bacterium]
MARFFNTTGPCDPDHHYMLAPERRLDDLGTLVARQQYFVLHAPRQLGKTTAMRALTARLRGQGYVALTASLETAQGVEAVGDAERLWIEAVAFAAEFELPEPHRPPPFDAVARHAPGARFVQWLRLWCVAVQLPVVLVLDEADVVRGPPLISLLRQLRAGFPHRGPGRFPTSVALVGMRDLRDYLVHAKDGAAVNPGSPFNIKSASLTLRSFHADEVRELLLQHTRETGQPWSDAALQRVWDRTQGQPFLVNALADRAVTRLAVDRAVPVDVDAIDAAEQQLILSRTTHLDNLSERLKEPRVAQVVQAVLLGDELGAIDRLTDDFVYVQDLGLVRQGSAGLEISNPIYREVLVRELSRNHQEDLPAPWWPWRTPAGRLDVPALIDAFFAWWRESADVLWHDPRTLYLEAAAHLAFMGFLQRVVNGGGRVEREYAAARGRVDVVVTFAGARHVFELKRVGPRASLDAVVRDGVEQLAGYLDTLGLREGWLLVFEPREQVPWDQKLWARDVERDGKQLHLRGG